MTRDEKLEAAAVAMAEAEAAVRSLESLARRMSQLVGREHDATAGAESALIQARIAQAKAGVVQRAVRRIPS